VILAKIDTGRSLCRLHVRVNSSELPRISLVWRARRRSHQNVNRTGIRRQHSLESLCDANVE
jgi:hypothetical protein